MAIKAEDYIPLGLVKCPVFDKAACFVRHVNYPHVRHRFGEVLYLSSVVGVWIVVQNQKLGVRREFLVNAERLDGKKKLRQNRNE